MASELGADEQTWESFIWCEILMLNSDISMYHDDDCMLFHSEVVSHPLPYDNVVDLSKLTAFADDDFCIAQVVYHFF